MPALRTLDLGRLDYDRGLAAQQEAFERALAAREAPDRDEAGSLLLLEHDPPVITVTRRPGAMGHLLASPESLARAGVTLAQTDRGGDITYHGPGQLVAYPIVDLNRLGWNLHRYMRELEDAVIRVCSRFGVEGRRDPGATGVWVGGAGDGGGAKICAMGVRVRRWITGHGLALNVSTNLDHFGLIVPCGLAGRPVTSLQRELGARCPAMPEVKAALATELGAAVESALAARR